MALQTMIFNGRGLKILSGGQGAINYVLPHNYQIIFAKPNTFHQLTQVSGRVGGTGTNDFERGGVSKNCLGGLAIQFCLTIINAYFQNQTQSTILR